ncbi:MAG: SRPBCC domain-containing protein [Candidatus Latescibacteria bacterium]|nr:SRPBCC domain-containing protein [Candidatus Latescibacterota bacterium]
MAQATKVEIHTASVAQEIRAPRGRVWGAVSEPLKMARWLCDGAHLDLRPGGRYDFWGKTVYGSGDRDQIRNPVTGYDPDERVAFEWDFVTRGGIPTRSRVNVHVDPGSTPETARIGVEHEIEFPRSSLAMSFREVWAMAFNHLLFDLEGWSPGLRYDFTRRARGLVEHSVRARAPVERCFQAIGTPEGIAATFTTLRRFDTAEGGAIDFGWPAEYGGPTRVLIYDPPRRLAYNWPSRDGERTHEGRVTWVLVPRGLETEIVLRQDGFPGDFKLEGEDMGWAGILNEIKKWVESQRPSTYLASRLDGEVIGY